VDMSEGAATFSLSLDSYAAKNHHIKVLELTHG
jgi:hypothetical protein